MAEKENREGSFPNYYIRKGILMRQLKPREIPDKEDWETCEQIVQIKFYKNVILKLFMEYHLLGT